MPVAWRPQERNPMQPICMNLPSLRLKKTLPIWITFVNRLRATLMVYGSKTMNRSYRNGGLFCYIGCAR